MPLPFKMQKTLVTFSLTLILKVRIPDIPKLLRNAKGYILDKLLRNMMRLEKKITHELFDYLHVHRPWTWKKDKVQVPQRSEMLSLYCTALGFIKKWR